MKFKNLKLALATSVLIIGGVAGFAAAKGDGRHGGPDRKAMMQKFDANGDGTLDDGERTRLKAEMQAMRAQHKAERLAKFDANKDGSIDDAERQAMFDAKALARFQRLDANRDGAISLDELKAERHGKRGGHRGFHGKGMHKQP